MEENQGKQEVGVTENLDFNVEDLRSMPEKELRARLRRIAERGNSQATAHNDALRFLSSLIDREDLQEPQALRIALVATGALGYLKSAASAGKLAAIASIPGDSPGAKSLRKEAKRALFQLKSWGIEPEPRAEGGEVAPAPPPPAGDREKIIQAAATAIDCDGNRIVSIFMRALPGRPLAIDFLINETSGIAEGFFEPTSKRRFQREVDAGKGGEFPVVEIDPEYCLFLVQAAVKRNEETQTKLPDAYRIWKEAIGDRKSIYDKHPIYSELDPDAIAQDKHLLADATSLFYSSSIGKFRKVFTGWALDPEIAWKYHLKAGEALTGVIIVDPIARNEQVERILADAADELFKNDGRRRFKYRLEEMAYMLLHSEERHEYEAKCCLATALAIDSGKRLLDIPFVHELISKSIGVFKRDEDEEDNGEDDTRLIINPFE
ncbi:MAG TPA: hypothetical protein GXX51_00030 [Firmicutes bacterium]|nr:hypothetical protein [Bacillota bacterium]